MEKINDIAPELANNDSSDDSIEQVLETKDIKSLSFPRQAAGNIVCYRHSLGNENKLSFPSTH